ncbi:MAG: SpoIIE family protein phosphatase [Snowella sp.]|nr:SpoIIE family protein phosphatase [Snowella sp.]
METFFSGLSQDEYSNDFSHLIPNLRHDFRTPINAIIGYSEMLLEEIEESEEKAIIENFQKINGAGRELLSLINQNLSPTLEKDLTHLTALQTILETLHRESRSSSEQILENCRLLKSNAAVTDLITDIDRIETATTRFCDMLIQGLKLPSLELESPDPISTATSVAILEAAFVPSKKPSVAEHYTAHLLVVDDNENNRDLFTRQLQREGYTVTTASNGREALEMVKTGAYELVLLDLRMPELDGYQVLDQLKRDEQWQHIPVIMISASDEIDQVVRCIEIGAEDFLPKPFNPTLLKARIGAALDKKRFRDRERNYLQQVESYSQKLNQELEKGRQMQLNFLPAEKLNVPQWEIATFFKPARQVAGDFYDTFPIMDNHVGLVIADVCDKGVGAALFMALFRSLIRIFSKQTQMRNLYRHWLTDQSLTETEAMNVNRCPEVSPRDVLEAVSLTNNYVAEHHGDLGMFATLFFGVLDPATGLLTYINGGHEPLFIINPQGEIQQQLNSTGPAVGMLPNLKFKIEQTHLEAGNILLGYTDGVPEARALDGSFFTSQRLKDLLQQPTPSATELLNRITDSVVTYIGEADQFDDITLLAIQRTLGSPLP